MLLSPQWLLVCWHSSVGSRILTGVGGGGEHRAPPEVRLFWSTTSLFVAEAQIGRRCSAQTMSALQEATGAIWPARIIRRSAALPVRRVLTTTTPILQQAARPARLDTFPRCAVRPSAKLAASACTPMLVRRRAQRVPLDMRTLTNAPTPSVFFVRMVITVTGGRHHVPVALPEQPQFLQQLLPVASSWDARMSFPRAMPLSMRVLCMWPMLLLLKLISQL
eukprot:SAG31_NODE_1150_length_9648_cov_37.362656_9_plen_221_part_00